MQGLTAGWVASPAKNSVPATGAPSASLSPGSAPAAAETGPEVLNPTFRMREPASHVLCTDAGAACGWRLCRWLTAGRVETAPSASRWKPPVAGSAWQRLVLCMPDTCGLPWHTRLGWGRSRRPQCTAAGSSPPLRRSRMRQWLAEAALASLQQAHAVIHKMEIQKSGRSTGCETFMCLLVAPHGFAAGPC